MELYKLLEKNYDKKSELWIEEHCEDYRISKDSIDAWYLMGIEEKEKYHLAQQYISSLPLSFFTIIKGEYVQVEPQPPPTLAVDYALKPDWVGLRNKVHKWGILPDFPLKTPLNKWIYCESIDGPVESFKGIYKANEIWRRHDSFPEKYLLYPSSLIMALSGMNRCNMLSIYYLKDIKKHLLGEVDKE